MSLSQINRLPNSRARGLLIEEFAADYLITHGMNVLYRNFRCRLGEIDIICEPFDNTDNTDNTDDSDNIDKQRQILVFVEVRFRKNNRFGGPLESIDWRKQRKLIRTADFFLKTHPQFIKTACRFDVLAVTLSQGKDNTPQIEWIQNAFGVK